MSFSSIVGNVVIWRLGHVTLYAFILTQKETVCNFFLKRRFKNIDCDLVFMDSLIARFQIFEKAF
ncbi:hypothetical protein D5E87_11585 [Vibrio parahaemolyticus]|nr:hypothetical protein D5E87_11585 [Vibrio parahaemolyticus]